MRKASFFGFPKWCIRKGLKICHLHISQNTTCLPPPPKKCLSIVISLSWEDYDAQEQEKVKTEVLHIFGGSNKVYYGKLLNGEYKHCTLSAILLRSLFLLLFVRRLSTDVNFIIVVFIMGLNL